MRCGARWLEVDDRTIRDVDTNYRHLILKYGVTFVYENISDNDTTNNVPRQYSTSENFPCDVRPEEIPLEECRPEMITDEETTPPSSSTRSVTHGNVQKLQ